MFTVIFILALVAFIVLTTIFSILNIRQQLKSMSDLVASSKTHLAECVMSKEESLLKLMKEYQGEKEIVVSQVNAESTLEELADTELQVRLLEQQVRSAEAAEWAEYVDTYYYDEDEEYDDEYDEDYDEEYDDDYDDDEYYDEDYDDEPTEEELKHDRILEELKTQNDLVHTGIRLYNFHTEQYNTYRKRFIVKGVAKLFKQQEAEAFEPKELPPVQEAPEEANEDVISEEAEGDEEEAV